MLRNILKGSTLYILVLIFIVPIIILVLFANTVKKENKTGSISTPTATPVGENVPLPSKEDVIGTFCELINEGRISDAVSMMETKDDATRQSWGVSLDNFSSFKLVDIKKSSIDETGNSFEVDINVTLKKNLTDLPIPNYGWVNGMNKKWINLTEIGQGHYKIAGIATGP